jgi:hypothetical protein
MGTASWEKNPQNKTYDYGTQQGWISYNAANVLQAHARWRTKPRPHYSSRRTGCSAVRHRPAEVGFNHEGRPLRDKIDEGRMSDRRNTPSSKLPLVTPLTKFDFGNRPKKIKIEDNPNTSTQ